MSKLSFRAKALDASKPMPIYMADELPDLPDYSAINRAVPQMPSGMKKEEECEHHLQRAICTGLIIPTPEVSDIQDEEIHTKLYPANYKQPRQLIHMQPFAMEQDITDYDMDSEDERWLEQQQASRHLLDLGPLKFEEMMDRLEKSSGQTVVSISDAKALLKEDDDLIIAVFDYWLNKRLKMQHPLILAVKTEQRMGNAPNNPYLAFRRRTEKMQTRKNRKNGEASYEKMLKLRRDLSRAVTLLELVKRREKVKREVVLLTLEVVEKRFSARDFSGAVAAEAAAAACAQLIQQRGGGTRPAFQPLFHNHHAHYAQSQGMGGYGQTAGASVGVGPYDGRVGKAILKDEVICRKERRQYKKRKHKAAGVSSRSTGVVMGADLLGGIGTGTVSSDDDSAALQHRIGARVHSPEPLDQEDDGPFAFRRNKLCTYHEAVPIVCGTNPWQPYHLQDDHRKPPDGGGHHQQQPPDKRYRYTLTSITARSDGDDDDYDDYHDKAEYWRRKRRRRCVGFARRRLGRGGRVILDRASAPGYPAGLASDEFWSALNYTIYDSVSSNVEQNSPVPTQSNPSTIPTIKQEPADTTEHNNLLIETHQHHHSYYSSGGGATTTTNSTSLHHNQQQRQTNGGGGAAAHVPLRRLSGGSVFSSSDDGLNLRRTSVTANNGGDGGGGSVVKVEAGEGTADSECCVAVGESESVVKVKGVREAEEEIEMVEFLQHVRSDWLHFRPRTPTRSPPCYLLPPLSPPSPFFSTDLPFTLELRPIPPPATPFYAYDDDDEPSPLLDYSPFITNTFVPPSHMADNNEADVTTFDATTEDDDEEDRGVGTGGNTGDSGVWSMEFGGGGSWKVTEEQEDDDDDDDDGVVVVHKDIATTSMSFQQIPSSSSLRTDSITLNNTKQHKPCGNDNDDEDIETTITAANNTIGSSTFIMRDIPNQTTRRKTNQLLASIGSPSISTTTTPPPLNSVVAKHQRQEEAEVDKPATVRTTTKRFGDDIVVINNSVYHQQQQRQQHGRSIPMMGVKKQMDSVRVTSLMMAGQQGGNGSRTAGLVWRGEGGGCVKGDGGCAAVQTNGILQCNNSGMDGRLDLQDVVSSSGVKTKNNRHHTFTCGAIDTKNLSNRSITATNALAHAITLNNSHSAVNTITQTTTNIINNNLTTTVVSLPDSGVSAPSVHLLTHPKVGMGGTSTPIAATGGSATTTTVVKGVVQQRKNNSQQQQLTTVMTEVT